MAYEVTAARKRPQTFDELAGQDFVTATLKNSLTSNMIAHAYLFSGPRGVGKTSAARILAKSLNCEKGITDIPCGTCSSCKGISAGNSLDVIEIDGASNTSVNDIRTIKEEVLFAPNSSRYKVYIIDEVHMLSNSAFNALLKTIEEPPPYIVFIFATTEIHKVPATIRSRCQQFNFRLLSIEKIKSLLEVAASELNVSAESDALLWIAREATGSMRDAYTLFDQVVSFSQGNVTLENIREKLGIIGLDTIDTFAENLADGNGSAVLTEANTILMSGVSIEQFVTDITNYFRSILFIKHNIRNESILGFDVGRFSSKVIDTFSVSQVEQILELLLNLHRNLKYTLNRNFELELTLSRMASMADYITPGEILKKIETIKQQLRDGALAEVTESVDVLPQKEKMPEEHALTPEQIGSIIDSIKKQKLALSSALEKAVLWKRNGENITLLFNSTYSANFVTSDLSSIRETISEILGINVHVSVLVSNEKSSQNQSLDTSVEMVKKVFRGEIVKGGTKQDESNGSF